MPPFHTAPFIQRGLVITPVAGRSTDEPFDDPAAERCDYCGSPRLEWRKCKLVCNACRQINKSCADL